MTMASGYYLQTYTDVYDASQLAVSIGSDSFKGALVSDTYTPNFNTHTLFSSVTNEVTGTNWAAGGVVLASLTIVASGGFSTWDATDVSVATTTLTGVRGYILYDDTLANDPLQWAITFGADYATVAGTFAVVWNASGIARVSA